ncbi:GerAB/ArcD/ProY family transporter [Anaerobacillus sp. MEB173]|uniref:GerAB/ArcD/ProY family transporter n=1 Tax=Anaerobacillus sp. MEB173 TaxID=3383345 RepID=UPI003F8F48EB
MKIQITNGMFMAIIISMVYPKAVGVTQGIIAREVGGDMWIATLFGIAIAGLVMYLTISLIKRLPEKNLFDHSEVLFGKWISRVVSFLVFIFFVGAYGQMMITFSFHLKDYFLPDAPVVVFVIVPMIVGYFAVYQGLEVIGRISLIGLFAIAFFNVILLIGSLSNFSVSALLPVMRNGFLESVAASRHHFVDWAMATLMAAMILPYVKEKQKWSKTGRTSVMYGGLFIIIWPILQIGVLTPQLAGQFIVSCMLLARSAEIGLFIHRYEMIMVIFYSIPLLIQIMMGIMCASISAAHSFGIKDIRPVLLPVTFILGGFSYWVIFDHIRAMDLLTYYWPSIAIPIAIGLPVIIIIIGFFMKKKLQQHDSTASQ